MMKKSFEKSHPTVESVPAILVEVIPPNRLAEELSRLGVHFLRTSTNGDAFLPLAPIQLIKGLATSSEARLRLGLIPLLLWRPDFAPAAKQAARELPSGRRLTLQCYYTAAMILQARYHARLEALGAGNKRLPDLFSRQIGLTRFGSNQENLAQLAERQVQLTGEAANWLGSYHYAANTFLKHMEKEFLWGR